MFSEPNLPHDIFDILYESDVGIAICDGKGRLVWGNPKYQRITNFEINNNIGRNILDLQAAHGVKVLGDENILSVILKKRVSCTYMVNFNTGHDIIATGTPLFNTDGSLRWIMYSLTDCDQIFQMQQQLAKLAESVEASQARLREALLEQSVSQNAGYVVRDKKMLDIYALALRIAQVSATVLILGETGTGKDHLAKFIHSSGDRKEKNFVHVNCSAIPENLFESELFGYEAGAFTGASRKGKMGFIEFANHGTLYLDEVAELPLNLQTKLLSVLQHSCLTRIGGVKPVHIDVRLIAATNHDLQAMVAEKLFREDLYYRLNVIELRLPALRERRDDIIPLLLFFLKHFNQRYQANKRLSQHAMEWLHQYTWPGNVRELEHLVERLVIITPEDFIGEEQVRSLFPPEKAPPALEGRTLKEILASVEEQTLREAIRQSFSLKDAAAKLGIDISTLVRKKQKYGIYLKKDYGSRSED